MINEILPRDGLAFFLYRSMAVPGLGESDLAEIVTVARARNQATGLTGCLHYEDGLFFQWLEGPAPDLWRVVDSIRRDPRHRELTVLEQGPLAGRRFQSWRMRFSDRDHASLMDWFAGKGVSTVDPSVYAGNVASFLVTAAG